MNWTGHAFVDVGIAGLCVLSDKTNPRDLSERDLDEAADEMARRYFDPYYSSYLTCVFPNSEFVQPGLDIKKEQSRKRYVDRVLRAHRWTGDEEAEGKRCVFSGELATHVIHRSQMPLMTGVGVLNFFPNLQGALTVAGPYLTALQTLPLAGRRCEGKLLVVHGDDPALTLAFARQNWNLNRTYFNLATTDQLPKRESAVEGAISSWDDKKGSAKYADAKAPATVLLHDLEKTLELLKRGDRKTRGGGAAYWVSNSGQGPSLRVFALPGNLVSFLGGVIKGEYAGPWRRIVAQGWPDFRKDGKGLKRASDNKPEPGVSRNQVHQDLLEVFEESGWVNRDAARRFITAHLLHGRREIYETDRPDGGRPLLTKGTLRDWSGEWLIAEKFLSEVLGVNESRIACIRQLGDRIASEIQRRRDKRLLRRILVARRFDELVDVIRKAMLTAATGGNGDLLPCFDDLVKAFEIDENLGHSEWRLVRALLGIRIIEKLVELRAVDGEMLPEDEEEESEVSVG